MFLVVMVVPCSEDCAFSQWNALFHNVGASLPPAPGQEFSFGYGSYERTVEQLAKAVTAHTYVAGDRFTAADVYVDSHVGWVLGLQTLPPRAEFLAYAAKLTAHAAYQRAAMKDNAPLAHAT